MRIALIHPNGSKRLPGKQDITATANRMAPLGLLSVMKRGLDPDRIRRTVGRIQKSGPRVKGLFMMGLPGETADSIRETSDFALSLNLDDMNMAKFTPFPGMPVRKEIDSLGRFSNDWPLMNCLNFVFVPRKYDAKQQLDQLYNWHVRRFYRSKGWRKKFIRRLWQHRESLLRLACHLPAFRSARSAFARR